MSEAVYKLNLPPETFVRVAHGDMQDFVAAVARAAGLVADRAALLGELLTSNDLRGVFSHGTRQDLPVCADDARRRAERES